jgi:hypothetical protein
MNRLITVKGSGNASANPDLIIVDLEVESKKRDYEETLEHASYALKQLQNEICKLGFNVKDLKTTSFNINTRYESYKDQYDNYKSRFVGYSCFQELKLEFDFNTKMLSRVLEALSNSSVNPKINIKFSIKDSTKIREELLISATRNAKERATILAKASNVTLGDLITIDYSWGEVKFQSPTRYDMHDRCMTMKSAIDINLEPEDIRISDTVTFVWEIK